MTAYGTNTLYHNDGNGTFTDVTPDARVGAGGWSSSAGWFDYDKDGYLDLFVARYLEWGFAENPYCGEDKPGHRAYCHPKYFPATTSLLFRNNGDGRFTEISERSRLAASPGKALGVGFLDYDQDGWTDIFVANDSVPQQLFRNHRGLWLEESALSSGVAFDEDAKTFAGMGVDCADYDNDGRPDIFVTNLSNEKYALFRNEGAGTFGYASMLTGVGQATRPWSGWSTRFLDFDHDGLKDIWVAQGHVLDTIQLTSPHLRYLQPPLILRNTGSSFVDAARLAGLPFAKAWAGRGASFGDIDNDGDMDIVASNCDQRAYVLRNDGGKASGNWLLLNLEGTRSNRGGIGALVKTVARIGPLQYGAAQTAIGYCSSSDRRIHFGLAGAASVDLEIRWPSGIVQRISNVKVNQILTLREPASGSSTAATGAYNPR